MYSSGVTVGGPYGQPVLGCLFIVIVDIRENLAVM